MQTSFAWEEVSARNSYFPKCISPFEPAGVKLLCMATLETQLKLCSGSLERPEEYLYYSCK